MVHPMYAIEFIVREKETKMYTRQKKGGKLINLLPIKMKLKYFLDVVMAIH